MNKLKITACGECCTYCKKYNDTCQGCIETNGYCEEWKESGQCIIFACVTQHKASFCGLCSEFPCKDINKKIFWKDNIIEEMQSLKRKFEN